MNPKLNPSRTEEQRKGRTLKTAQKTQLFTPDSPRTKQRKTPISWGNNATQRN
jgi:hypothetical protein